MRARCPDCDVFSDFRPLGPYRLRCSVCGAIVKNDEVTEEKETDESS
jgi:hypothetical protein